MLTPPDHERLTVEERPDAAVLAEEEADPAELTSGAGDERTTVDEVTVGGGRRGGARMQPFGPVGLQLGAGAALLVDDEHRLDPVEQERAALRVAEAGRIGHRQPRLVARSRR